MDFVSGRVDPAECLGCNNRRQKQHHNAQWQWRGQISANKGTPTLRMEQYFVSKCIHELNFEWVKHESIYSPSIRRGPYWPLLTRWGSRCKRKDFPKIRFLSGQTVLVCSTYDGDYYSAGSLRPPDIVPIFDSYVCRVGNHGARLGCDTPSQKPT